MGNQNSYARRCWLGFAMMLLFSPHYPWYIVWLIPFFALLPNLPLLTYLMMFFYMFTTALADGTAPKMFVLNEILYGAVAVRFCWRCICCCAGGRCGRCCGFESGAANAEDADDAVAEG
jgi:hypothetical protein